MSEFLKRYSKFTIKKLKVMCTWRGLRYNTNTRKPEFMRNIGFHDCARLIQRVYRDRLHEECCPISLQVIKIPYQLGTVKYDAVSLVDYFSVSGDFRDPMSRQPVPKETMRQLDIMMLEYGVMKPSLLFLMKQNIFGKNTERRNMLLALESQVSFCMDKINMLNDSIFTREIHRYFHYGLLPQVNELLLETHDYVSQMVMLDRNYTRSVINDFVSAIRFNASATSLKLYVLERLEFESFRV